MKIKKEAICGTLESNDLLVKVVPFGGLQVSIYSEVMRQFGARIREVVDETLKQMNVSQGKFVIEDKGALDCAIRARVQTAVLRGCDSEELDWKGL
jgi:citrate lyase subunit gamma (acyl carrier protein)